MNALIYTLSDPRTGAIRYVGKTIDLEYRFKTHLRKESSYKGRWVQSLIAAGLKPEIEILDVVPESEWQFWEQHWIQVVRGWGFNLTNGDAGGLGHGRITAELAAKISKTLSGRPNKALAKEVHRYSLDGEYLGSHNSFAEAAKFVGGHHANIVRAAKERKAAGGFLWSYEKTDFLQRAEKPPISAETLEKRRIANIGRKVSAETRAKQRIARLGREPANKGKRVPEWVRQKNSDTCTTKRAVVQKAMDGTIIREFGSIKEAALVTGATRCGIANTSSGNQSHAAGFKWEVLR